MPIYTSINVNLTNDLSGTLDEPYVISVEHINQGILKVQNGGLNTEIIPKGTVIVGNDYDTPIFLTGSDNNILMWSATSSSWIAKDIDIITGMSLSASDNSVFVIDDLSIDKNKTYNLVFQTQSSGLFLASPSNSSGILSARRISQSDLPPILENLDLIDCNLSGTFTGSANFTSIQGDGSLLYNLSSSQINNFEEDVEKIIVSASHIYENLTVRTASLTNVIIENLIYATGSFNGDGSGLENLSVDSIGGFYEAVTSSFVGGNGINISGNIISSTVYSYEFYPKDSNVAISSSGQDIYIGLSDNITTQKITASSGSYDHLDVNTLEVNNFESPIILSDYISSSNFVGKYSGVLSGTYSGSGEYISNIPNDSLVYDFININNTEVKLGESIQVSGISTVSSSNINILTTLSGSKVTLELQPIIQLDGVFASTLNATYVSASEFIGDGRNITNISFDNIGSASIDSLTSQLIDSVQVNAVSINSSVVSSSQFYGDGFYITNLDADNIYNLDLYFNNVFTGSQNIVTETTVGNTTSTSVILKDNITITSITSSFNGDGSKITNIQSPLINVFNGTNLSIGDIVYVSSGSVYRGDNRNKNLCNVIGVVNYISGSDVYVQLNGQINITNITSSNSDLDLFLGTSGNYVSYSYVPANSYAVKVGRLISTNKIMIDIKKLWKVK